MKQSMWPNLNFFKRPKPVVQYRVIEREPFKLTTEEWRSDPALCAGAKGVLQSPLVTQMLQTLRNSHPAFFVLTDSSLNDRMVHQARGEGYTMALRDLELLGEWQKAPRNIEPEFADEEIAEEAMKPYRVPILQKPRPAPQT